MISALGRLTKDYKTLADLSPDDHRILLSKGLTETDWQVWRKAMPEDWGNGHDTMLTAESVYAIPDAKIDAVIAPQIKSIRDTQQGRIDELNAKNAEDLQRIQDRFAKLQQQEDATGAKISDRMARFEQRRAETEQALQKVIAGKEGKAADVKAALKGQMDLLSAKVERAQVQADIEAYLRTETQQSRVMEFLAAVDDGASIDRQIVKTRVRADRLPDSVIQDFSKSMSLGERAGNSVQRFAGLIGKIGEELGRREGAAKQRIKELEAAARRADRELKKEIAGKGKDVAARIEAQAKEVDAFIDQANARQAERVLEVKAYADRVAQRQAMRVKVAASIEKSIAPMIADARMAAREQAATKLLAHVLEETNMAVIEPGAWERTLMHGGMQRGTLKGELTKSVFLFKSFGVSMVNRHFRRAWNMPTNLGTAGYIAALAATSTLLGALAVQVSEMISGRDPRNMASGKFAYAAMMKGGGFGILGDFAFSDTTQYGNSMLATAAGPMAGLAEDVFNLTKGNLAQAARGEETNAGAEVVRFAKGNIPVIGSLWYTKAALNHLFIYQLQEMASPGYLGRMEGRARREFGQDYWWAPEDVTPQDYPDFSKGWQ